MSCEVARAWCTCITIPRHMRQVEEKRKEIQEAEKAADAAQARVADLRTNEKECVPLSEVQ